MAICIFTLNKVIFPFDQSKRPRPYQWFIIQISWILNIASLLILVEKLFLQSVSVSFHKVAYSERILLSKRASVILDRLKAASVKKQREANQIQRKSEEEESKGLPLSMEAIGAKTYQSLQQVGEKTGISSFVRSTKEALNRTAHAVISKDNTEINSSKEARRLAKKIFDSFCHPSRQVLILDDFMPFFKSRDMAVECFDTFCLRENGEITKNELCRQIIEIYKERKYLARSVRDIGHCIGQLDSILMTFCVLILIIVSCLLLDVDVTSLIASFGTLLLGLTFIFGSSAKNLFECLVFLFIVHPYDVGDRVCFLIIRP